MIKDKEYTAYYLEGFFSNGEMYQGLMEAYGRYNLYTKAITYIEPDNIIVGRLDKAINKEVVTNYVSLHNINNSICDEIYKSQEYSDDEKNNIAYLLDKIRKYCLSDSIKDYATPAQQLVEESGAAFCQHFNGHIVMDYEYLFSKGFCGVREDILKYKKINTGKEQFYDALEITLNAMAKFILNHAKLARDLICSMDNRYDMQKLEQIEQCCNNICNNKPKTFYEGVQLQWFIMQFEDYDSFGRYDQYLYELYKQDIESGLIDIETAKAYIKDMMRRVDDNGNIINMTIGGVNKNGDDAVNDLTYIVLEATRELGFKGPNLCLRITDKSDEKLWEQAGISLSYGQGLPAIYNDNVFIKMLMENGIEKHDANNYCLAGCSQVVIPGKSNYACDMGLYTPLKMLELALFDGYDYRINKQVGPKTGKACEFNAYEELLEAYNIQMKYCVRAGIALNDQDVMARKDFLSCVRTMFTTPCIQRGKGIFEAGAEYNGIQGEVVGLTNTANAIVAIKELVFDQKKFTMKQILTALRTNFYGYEKIQLTLKNKTSKFGNDIPFVDNIRAKITKDIYAEIASYTAYNGGVHWAGEVIFNYYYDQGRYCMASTDGRSDFSVLADSSGPQQGTDLNGPTAIINSALKIPHGMLSTSINLNLKFSKILWEENRDKVVMLFKEYFRQGGTQVQVNVLDKQELLRAMENPDEYKGLVVRVGGYSGYFTQLNKEIQQEIIERTEH